MKNVCDVSASGSTAKGPTISSNTVHKSSTKKSSTIANLTGTTSATSVTQTGKCSTTSFLTVGVAGRLGNQISEYATLLSHSKRLEMIPFIPKHQKQMLSAIFR